MNYYHVLIGTKHIDLVQALTIDHAIQIVESKFGPANQLYVGNYRAVRA
jgi:hypothetical protein